MHPIKCNCQLSNITYFYYCHFICNISIIFQTRNFQGQFRTVVLGDPLERLMKSVIVASGILKVITKAII